VPAGLVFVDGLTVGEIGAASLKDRRILRDEGFISIFVVVDSVTGKVAAGPSVQARGFVENDEVFAEVIPRIEEALAHATESGVRDAFELQQVVRRVVGKWVGGKLRRRPMIIPVVIEA
jgi:ribonuclease J